MGDRRRHQSDSEWSILPVLKLTDWVIEQYLIRVSVSCPDSAINFVPTYKHASRIGVATERWAFHERGLLGFGGFSNPAVGMRDERLEIRRVSNVNVGW